MKLTTVAELIVELQEIIAEESELADAVIVQSQDAEGNGFSPLDELGLGKYSIGLRELVHPDDVDDYDDLVDSVCLWPVN